jgi:hypothetical protein
MVICQNCRSSWPDDCKFCGMCGHQINELADKETLQLAGHIQHLKKVQNGSRPAHLTTVVLSLIVVFIASITLFFTYFNRNNVPSTAEPDQSIQTPIPPTLTPPTPTYPVPTYPAPAYPTYPTPAPMPSPTTTPSPTPSPTPKATPSPTPSPMPSPTPTPTNTNNMHKYNLTISNSDR